MFLAQMYQIVENKHDYWCPFFIRIFTVVPSAMAVVPSAMAVVLFKYNKPENHLTVPLLNIVSSSGVNLTSLFCSSIIWS